MRWFREARRPRPGRKSEARKQFFLEKKHQKTFALVPRRPVHAFARTAARNRQKFFGSFFQKRTAFFALSRLQGFTMSRILRTYPSDIFSRAVEYHGFVYTQGLVPRNADAGVAEQVSDVLAQIDDVLEAHGTDKTRLLTAQIWLKDIADRAVLNAAWAAWLPEASAPARALVQAVLADPRWRVEIMITACK
jgi:enamine deaminase RidA (YjgF/YER057c/UK114 family)